MALAWVVGPSASSGAYETAFAAHLKNVRERQRSLCALGVGTAHFPPVSPERGGEGGFVDYSITAVRTSPEAKKLFFF